MTDKDTRPPHNFVANHLEVGSFEEGFRAYAQYRDLGMVEATNGMVRAHVIKLLGYSDDCELLEIIMPADFDTEDL